jgi:hypothetical protein
MARASDQLHSQLESLAEKHAVSVNAVQALFDAVAAGRGSMAQFHHPELGGSGQWMRGGMTMVGRMGDQRLQQTVSSLCAELSALLAREPDLQRDSTPGRSGEGSRGSQWWPAALGNPSASGSQNDTLYAYFVEARRLALSRAGEVTIYDTLEHRVSGVQQQQGGGISDLSFTSQLGTFTVVIFPVVHSSR